MAVAAVAAVLHVAVVEVAAVQPVAAVEVAAVLPVAAQQVFAARASVYLADAHFLEAGSAAVAVAAEAAEAGAAELAGYGHPPGAGSTPAGPNLHLRVKNLASRRSQSGR